MTAGVLAAVTATASAPAADATPGRDPFFPNSGSGAYDVSHYSVWLRYTPAPGGAGGGRIGARTDIRARANRALGRFSLDLVGLEVAGVEVDGERARFRRRGGKLVVNPSSPPLSGSAFSVTVRYHGAPRSVTDPDNSSEGWLPTGGGGAVALGEPVGTATWIPCNNSLSDKARFDFHLTVRRGNRPKAMTGVANGRLLAYELSGSRAHPTRSHTHFSMRQPMAPYLATVAIGDFRIVGRTIGGMESPGGLRSVTAVDASWYASRAPLVRSGLRALPGILRFEEGLYGPYPFDAVGTTVTAGGGDYALETQTRPTYPSPPRRNLLVHELSHQWVGDSVGLRRWPDIWLNEGFATFTEWVYRERHGGPTARAVFDELRSRPPADPFWTPPPGRPGGPENLFAGSVYVRGAMTLEALRIRIGDRAFFRVLRRWAITNRFGNVGTHQFIEFAEQQSGRRLDDLFARWLFRPGKV